MNAPFTLHEVLAEVAVSISDLKKNPAAVIAEAGHRQVAILNRNRPVAYVIAPHVWERIVELLDDMEDAEVARERLGTPGERSEVSIDEL